MMGLLDNTVSKAREVIDSAEKTAKTTVAVQKLKIKAIGIDRSLTDLYVQLGRMVYQSSQKADAVPEEQSELIAKIEEKLQELETVKEKIVFTEGGTVCLSCGALNLDGSNYCHKCGKEI